MKLSRRWGTQFCDAMSLIFSIADERLSRDELVEILRYAQNDKSNRNDKSNG
jgi:hypothetical protein